MRPPEATHAAFAGNFNKAATISLWPGVEHLRKNRHNLLAKSLLRSIFLGLELLPGGHWSTVMVLGIAGPSAVVLRRFSG